ncbi:hypothetical protein ABZ622_38940 [Streptomyces sp. NPDC007164]|uniref:tetratricopeptide repeat protein n=1 Tax=Streptomyces sp. NPDC007164 TaxID=3156918 RepID=UPI00340F9EFF
MGLGEALTERGDSDEARICLSQVVELGDAVDSAFLSRARKRLETLPAVRGLP